VAAANLNSQREGVDVNPSVDELTKRSNQCKTHLEPQKEHISRSLWPISTLLKDRNSISLNHVLKK